MNNLLGKSVEFVENKGLNWRSSLASLENKIGGTLWDFLDKFIGNSLRSSPMGSIRHNIDLIQEGL